MANEDCAKWLIELYADYFELSSKYGRSIQRNTSRRFLTA
jgi:hypothetical protein